MNDYLIDRATGCIIYECPACGAQAIGAGVTYHELAHRDHPSMQPIERPRRRLTRQEQLEGLADRGCDTHAEYNEER